MNNVTDDCPQSTAYLNGLQALFSLVTGTKADYQIQENEKLGVAIPSVFFALNFTRLLGQTSAGCGLDPRSKIHAAPKVWLPKVHSDESLLFVPKSSGRGRQWRPF